MVQQFGLELLILADGWASGEKWDERLRLALVASGMDPRDVFAHMLDGDDDDDRDLDYSAVDWQEGSTPDDWELLQQALSSARVTVPGARQEAETQPSAPELPDVDFDREWQ